MLDRLKTWFGLKPLSDDEFERRRRELLAKSPVPVFWLFGKTGSGKTSIVRYLTGATDAQIGSGFRPQTKTSLSYAFPSDEQPLMRFIDTRGVGEAGYDPTDDLATFDQQAHAMVVTVRVMDHALGPVIEPLRRIRATQPSRPILLALTALHEAYPGEQHPSPDPYTVPMQEPLPPQLPADLRRSIAEHQHNFAGLVDAVVAIDLTKPEDGFHEPEFGGERLKAALVGMVPEALRHILLYWDDMRQPLQDLTQQQAMPTILTYSSLSATAAATPLPWVDIPIVLGLQSRLIYLLADLFNQPMNAKLIAQLAGGTAGGIALRSALIAPIKFVPFVGEAANALAAFVHTYSLGKTCCWYFGRARNGVVPTSEEFRAMWREQLDEAVRLWNKPRAKPT